MISMSAQGDFKLTQTFLMKVRSKAFYKSIVKYGDAGVDALARATPKETGVTAAAWTYEIKVDANSFSIIWSNTNLKNGTPVAIFIQYGHGTGTGGYVPGTDFINPALKPIFDQIIRDVWREVTS